VSMNNEPMALPQVGQVPRGAEAEEWDFDVSIIESGPAADQLIRLTNDGCGTTCQSACSPTCP